MTNCIEKDKKDGRNRISNQIHCVNSDFIPAVAREKYEHSSK